MLVVKCNSCGKKLPVPDEKVGMNASAVPSF